ncbi:MAG: DinB family protein [Gemmatimonadaceae bacterium]
MTAAEFIDLYEYNKWAHLLMLESAAVFNAEEYARPIPSSFPSLRLSLEHMLAAEVVWLSRWEGHSLGDAPDYSGCRDVTSLRAMWDLFWNRQFAFLLHLCDDDLARPVSVRTRTGIETVQSLHDTMVHVVNHSSYHRGQVVTIIHQLGGKPMNSDYLMFCVGRES